MKDSTPSLSLSYHLHDAILASIAAIAMALFVLIELKYGFNPAVMGLIFLVIVSAILSLVESVLRGKETRARDLFRDLMLNYFEMYLVFIYAIILSILPRRDALTQLSTLLVALLVVANAVPLIFDLAGRGSDPPDRLRRDFEELRERMGIRADVRLRLFKSSLLKTALLGGLIRPTVFVNEDLLSELSEGEIRSILAHELAHYMGGDLIRYVSYSLLVYLVLLLTGEAVTVTGLARGSGAVTPVVMIVGFVTALFIFLVLVRRRETRADLVAASFTNPDDLISALIKIHGMRRSPSFLPTHPSLEDRIEAIRRARPRGEGGEDGDWDD